MSARLSADIGGTFTDLVLLDDDGQLHVQKTPSTPKDFKDGVLSGVTRILEDASAARGARAAGPRAGGASRARRRSRARAGKT